MGRTIQRKHTFSHLSQQVTNSVNFTKVSVVIPVYNCEKTIKLCLESLLKNDLKLVAGVVIVLDGCTDRSEEIITNLKPLFVKHQVPLSICSNNENKGKVFSIVKASEMVKTKEIMLLDADIVLEPEAILRLLQFHQTKQSTYTSCLIYPYSTGNSNFISKIIDNDRLYRQNILQIVRTKFGVANFPGGVGIVNIDEYKGKLLNGFLEDLSTTYKIIGSKHKVEILPRVYAYEIERSNLLGVYHQRSRWTIGNIQNIPLLFKTIMNSTSFTKRILILSYPVMWYIQHYVIVIGIVLSVFLGPKYILLLPFVLYFLQVFYSAEISKKNYQNNAIFVFTHSIIFPFVVTLALFRALFLLIENRSYYFYKPVLFNRSNL